MDFLKTYCWLFMLIWGTSAEVSNAPPPLFCLNLFIGLSREKCELTFEIALRLLLTTLDPADLWRSVSNCWSLKLEWKIRVIKVSGLPYWLILTGVQRSLCKLSHYLWKKICFSSAYHFVKLLIIEARMEVENYECVRFTFIHRLVKSIKMNLRYSLTNFLK